MIRFLDINGDEAIYDETQSGNFAYNADCMEFMRNCPDKLFDLAVVDPPYGGSTDMKHHGRGGTRFGGLFDRYKKVERTGSGWENKYKKKIIDWDEAPKQEYFDELFRISKNQIIWGGNYFSLPPTRGFIVWDKMNISENFSMSMCEYAWSSFINTNAKIVRVIPQGVDTIRFHPTQKPVKLYDWIYSNYAKEGDKILDTHLGSGANRISALRVGLDFVGLEIDSEYFSKSQQWFESEASQISLFD